MNKKYTFSDERNGKKAPSFAKPNKAQIEYDHVEGKNNLDLTISGNTADVATLIVEADGEPVKLKYNKYQKFYGTVATDKSEITLKMYTHLDIRGGLWFLSSLLYFFLGIFGIFDRNPNRKCRCLNFSLKITLPSDVTNVALRLLPFKEGEGVVAVATEAPIDIETSQYFVDAVAKKRLKIMVAVKLVLTILILAACGFLAYMLLSQQG